MHGGVKFYRGAAGAARTYVEADRSRADDYYLAEGTGVAERYVATDPTTSTEPASAGLGHGEERTRVRGSAAVSRAGAMDGDSYEQWVAGYDTTGAAKGRLRKDARGLRFVEVVVNGPKTWSLAASLHPEIAAAYDQAQERAAVEIIGWLAENSTTRIGPGGRQVQVPVDELEAAVVRHYTSRAGDPHRHLHLQINARVKVDGRWRGLHSVGTVDSIQAINGIGHAAVICDPEFRQALADHGYTLDPESGEVRELADYAGAFSARAAQISRNVDRYEATWRAEHPGQEPGPKLRRSWDRRAWAQARPDKVIPESGSDLARRWVEELHDLGFTPPTTPVDLAPTAVGRINRDAVTQLALTRLGSKRSAWNAADIRGEVEKILASRRRHHRPGRASRAGRGPHRTHRPGLHPAPRTARRPRTRPVADLTDRAGDRGRPRRPTRRPRIHRRGRRPGRRRPGRDRSGRGPATHRHRVGRHRTPGRDRRRRRCREDHDPGRGTRAPRPGRSPADRGHADVEGSAGRLGRARHPGVLRGVAGPPARVPMGRGRPVVTAGPRQLRPGPPRRRRPPEPR